MKQVTVLSILAAAASSLAAQSNTVPGLDGRLTVVDQFTYQGRRGAAYPNGEVGAAMYNEMCNPGTVNIPWAQAMSADHPKFGFLMVRVANDRLEQISDRSYCKHAFTSTNYDGPCGTCISPGTGALMGVHCADAYGVGNNADRHWLGPADELNPWLGTWSPVGSYFDQGDPNVGSPGNNDGVRSPWYTGTDAVKNRVTMKESDLITPGAQYFYGIHLMHQGEAVGNRGDNLASRGCTPTWNGSTWSFPNNAVGQAYGSILQRWSGATLNSGGNGSDDGRFFVAVKTTSLGGGLYHYEYAIHNVDNHRGGATFKVPVDPAGVVSNYSFGDIDSDPLNDWTAARVGNEIIFSAGANNALKWNTIYNFGFDCTVQPSTGNCTIDEANPGPGAGYVSVTTKIPSGLPGADATNVGAGCVSCFSSFYETPGFDLANTKIKLTYSGGKYTVGVSTNTYVAPSGGSLALTDDSEASTALPFTLPYPGGSTTTLRVCSNGFISPGIGNGTTYTPSVSGLLSGALPRWAAYWHDLAPSGANNVYVNSATGVVRVTWLNVPNYGSAGPNTFQVQFESSGDVHILYQTMTVGSGEYLVGWSKGGSSADPGSRDLSASLAAGFSTCVSDVTPIAMSASARPILNTTVNLQVTNLPGSTVGGVMVYSPTSIPAGIDLTYLLDMAGCYGYLSPDILSSLFLTGGPSYNWPFFVPNSGSLVGQTTMFQALMIAPGFTGSGFLSSNGVQFLYGLQ